MRSEVGGGSHFSLKSGYFRIFASQIFGLPPPLRGTPLINEGGKFGVLRQVERPGESRGAQTVDKHSGAAAPNGFPRGEAVERSETEEEIERELWTKKTQILMSVFVQQPTFQQVFEWC